MVNESLKDLVQVQEGDNAQIKNLKATMGMLKEKVEQQDCAIAELKNNRHLMNESIKDHTNKIYSLSGQVIELERYSRKLCLMFSNVELENPVATVLSIMKNCMQINISEADFAACHPLQNEKQLGPIIFKFIYHQHRDLAWNRRSWLKNFQNSAKGKIYIEECLAPSDRQLRVAAKEQGIKTITRKQQIFAINENIPNANPVKVQSVEELEDFRKPEKRQYKRHQILPNKIFTKSHKLTCSHRCLL